jgi:hypothetical protein
MSQSQGWFPHPGKCRERTSPLLNLGIRIVICDYPQGLFSNMFINFGLIGFALDPPIQKHFMKNLWSAAHSINPSN